MDQVKIGSFIAERRKAEHLTQTQVAERLGVTDRAVSKWERGKSLPDASLMLDLCLMLNITVNDLLCGEVVTMDKYNETTEKNLVSMVAQKEAADKRLLMMEIFLGITSTLLLFAMIAIGTVLMTLGYAQWIFFLLFGIGMVQFFIFAMIAVRIEQVVGYYQCAHCGHTHVPSYAKTLFAMHINRTRYLKCPHCQKYSWQKKVIKKN